MKNHVEPPILLSRIITFALAGALVVLGTLIITLADMFPLNRPQVFFLTTIQRANQDITLTHLHPKDENLDALILALYNFCKEADEYRVFIEA